ncbi:radical SAM protein [Ruminococcaceae bacterium OttesenSCG-928-I18]|nr:radical SAM protein [Ruminococcaceae bacterium OttesenSCG-928-I18]
MKTVPAKTLLSRNQHKGWFGCDYNMNLYRGCTHGCLYCDSRSDCYHIDCFDEVVAKENALSLLQKELARKVKTGVIASGAMSDPYNPFEADTLLTRHSLELVSAYGFGIALATKSDLICRDIDILKEISAQSPVLCKLTITTVRDDKSSVIEPFAPSSSRRLAALHRLSSAGLFTGVLLMPVLPWLTDDEGEILALVDAVAEAGARFIYPSFGVTMRAGQRQYFLCGLDKAYPEQKWGEKYGKKYGTKYYCASPKAKILWEALTLRCQRHGLLYQMPEIIAAYREGYENQQLSFF